MDLSAFPFKALLNSNYLLDMKNLLILIFLPGLFILKFNQLLFLSLRLVIIPSKQIIAAPLTGKWLIKPCFHGPRKAVVYRLHLWLGLALLNASSPFLSQYLSVWLYTNHMLCFWFATKLCKLQCCSPKNREKWKWRGWQCRKDLLAALK